MNTQVTDVISAVQSYVAKGYDREYRVKDGHLVDLEFGSKLDACSMRVDAALRLESGDDAEDATNIYAFDVFDEICHADFSEQLLAHRETVPTGDRDVPSKHGLRKVYKREFEQEPERYVLREGFPDFPACPFGGAFSILGFDTAEQTYVWLVTSIIRDPRLIRAPYQGEDFVSDE